MHVYMSSDHDYPVLSPVYGYNRSILYQNNYFGGCLLTIKADSLMYPKAFPRKFLPDKKSEADRAYLL